ncbi:MAG: DUF6527 family protein [Sediminibacterium sp.]|nr:DUF6527 family protein [Sediminibacterium sp.]
MIRILDFFRAFKIWEKIAFIKWRKRKAPLYKTLRVSDFPEEPKPYVLYLLGKTDQEWLAGMMCPCGCGDLIELVLDGACPSWRLFISPNGSPTLSPSIYRSVHCQSHFFLENGIICWCSSSVTY